MKVPIRTFEDPEDTFDILLFAKLLLKKKHAILKAEQMHVCAKQEQVACLDDRPMDNGMDGDVSSICSAPASERSFTPPESIQNTQVVTPMVVDKVENIEVFPLLRSDEEAEASLARLERKNKLLVQQALVRKLQAEKLAKLEELKCKLKPLHEMKQAFYAQEKVFEEHEQTTTCKNVSTSPVCEPMRSCAVSLEPERAGSQSPRMPSQEVTTSSTAKWLVGQGKRNLTVGSTNITAGIGHRPDPITYSPPTSDADSDDGVVHDGLEEGECAPSPLRSEAVAPIVKTTPSPPPLHSSGMPATTSPYVGSTPNRLPPHLSSASVPQTKPSWPPQPHAPPVLASIPSNQLPPHLKHAGSSSMMYPMPGPDIGRHGGFLSSPRGRMGPPPPPPPGRGRGWYTHPPPPYPPPWRGNWCSNHS